MSWMEAFDELTQARLANVICIYGNVADIYQNNQGRYSPLKTYMYEKIQADIWVNYSPAKNFSCEEPDMYSKWRKAAHPYNTPVYYNDGCDKEITPKEAQWVHSQKANESFQRLYEFMPAIVKTLESNTQKTVMWIEGIESIIPNSQRLTFAESSNWEMLESIAQNFGIQGTQNIVIIVVKEKSEIHRGILGRENYVEEIEIPYPTKEKVKSLLESMEKSAKGNLNYEPSQDAVVRSAEGISLRRLYKEICKMTTKGNVISMKKIAGIQREVILSKTGGLLEIQKPHGRFEDLGGLQNVKERLSEVSELLKNHHRICPKGLLFTGPPGTGKTAAARALANETGINFAVLKSIRGKWVGESESNMDKVLDTIRMHTPIIVFMDELDQGEGARGEQNTHDVDKRLFAKLLSFVSDDEHRGKILFVGATNRPDLIDDALKRSGRFEDKMYFPCPQASDLEKALYAILKREGIHDLQGEVPQIPEGFTGADLVYVVMSARQKAAIKKVQLDMECIEEAIAEYLPQNSSKGIQHMDDLALKEVTNARYLTDAQKKRREELI